jgi:hypothetical protein
MTPLRLISIALLSLAPSSGAGAQVNKAAADQTGREDLGIEAHRLKAPETFEKLAEDLIALESQTRSGLRKTVSANLLGGVVAVHGRPAIIVGPALALRVTTWGQEADDIEALRARFQILERHNARRLRALLSHECAEAKANIAEFETLLKSAFETMLKLELLVTSESRSAFGKLQERRVAASARQYAKAMQQNVELNERRRKILKEEATVSGELRERCRPSLTGFMFAALPEGSREPAQVTEEYDVQAKFEHLVLRTDELLTSWESEHATLVFLRDTAGDADILLDRIKRKLVLAAESEWDPFRYIFFEANVGYAFQLSETGLSSDLGGVLGGLGIGVVTNGPSLSIGFALLEGGYPGGYLAMSAELF